MRRSSTTSPPTSCGCSIPASARSPTTAVDLYPEDLRAGIDALDEAVYPALNNGVYRAGFATTQAAYEEAFAGVFAMLDALERRLAAGPWLFGERLTEADIRVFVTLARFDAAYHGQFKCNLRRIADYPNLSAYLAAPDRDPRLPRHVQPRPHQARLLLDPEPEPEPHRPGRGRNSAWPPAPCRVREPGQDFNAFAPHILKRAARGLGSHAAILVTFR